MTVSTFGRRWLGEAIATEPACFASGSMPRLSETRRRQGGQCGVRVRHGQHQRDLLKAFDLPVVFPEINSLQTAVRRRGSRVPRARG